MLEPFIGNGREIKARIGRGALDQHVVVSFQRTHFGYHIVFHQHALPVGQCGEILLDDQIADEIHAGTDRKVHQATFHLVGTVCQNPQTSRKAEILRITRYETQLNTLVPLHVQRVHDIILVEDNGMGFRQRAGEITFQQVDGIVVDVHVGKETLQNDVHDVARGEKLVQSF